MNPNQNNFMLPGFASFERFAIPPSNINNQIPNYNNYLTSSIYEPFQNYVQTPVIGSNSSLTGISQPQIVCYGEPVEPVVESPLKRPSSIENTPYENTKLQVKKVKSEENYKEESSTQASFANVTNFCESKKTLMKRFTEDKVHDFKHVIYNCLVDNYNSPEEFTFVQIYTTNIRGTTRHGFRFNEQMQPEKRLPELYSRHIRKARLELQDQNSVFIQDLYKFYLRACIELLSKYFEKVNKWTYLYEDVPLFVANESPADAEERIRTMRTRTRKKKAEKRE
mmetsp:Transcript_716/g.975  ORF Transcript_716/g.975 Transcript_716/m.975 type:complete len:281 (+) Transcript_716:165-1007(+)